jgi:hypothetical protein
VIHGRQQEIGMTETSTTKALFAAVGCLLLAACGPAKSSTAATANPAATAAVTGPATTATPTATAATVAAGGGSGLTACQLITEQDASTATGSPRGPGTSGGGTALSECIYGDGVLIVSTKTDSKAQYNKEHANASAKGATDVPGVGDSAFEAGNDQHCTLALLKGTTIVSVLYGGTSAKTVCVAVAKIAASKL